MIRNPASRVECPNHPPYLSSSYHSTPSSLNLTAMAEETTLHASCHCKASKFSFTVPTRSLPLPTHLCHCNNCRQTHGTLCIIHAPIPAPNVNLGTFSVYASSSYVTRYFCSTCGAQMLDKANEDGEEKWFVAVSMVDAGEESWAFHSHIFLNSTLDGGLATWLPEVGGTRMKMWAQNAAESAANAETGDWAPGASRAPVASGDSAVNSKPDKLEARCHCGGVEFYIARPRANAFAHMPASLTPRDKSKWYALSDVCTSCRLVSGCAIVSWAFPAISHVTLADGSPYTPVFGSIKTYQSSPGVTRTFCGTCGAVVTYACDDRPGMLDVGVGLLRAEGGARAEEWLEWRTHKVGYEEDCLWKGFLGSFREGLRSWGGVKRDGGE